MSQDDDSFLSEDSSVSSTCTSSDYCPSEISYQQDDMGLAPRHLRTDVCAAIPCECIPTTELFYATENIEVDGRRGCVYRASMKCGDRILHELTFEQWVELMSGETNDAEKARSVMIDTIKVRSSKVKLYLRRRVRS